VERYGFKGLPGKRTVSSSGDGSATAGVAFHYAGVFEFVTVTGASARWTQFQPMLARTDSHSLAEMALESLDSGQIVEVGWTVDRLLNGDSLPHLFVFHWVDGNGSCYNGCGWQQVSQTRYPGMVVSLTREPQQAIYRYFNGGWWVFYQSEWIGFFPARLWTVDFSTAGLVQWFGEVAGRAKPDSQMGDGLLPPQLNAAFMANLEVEDESGNSQGAALSPAYLTDPQTYELSVTTGAFSFGGPGYGQPEAKCATCASLLANCGMLDDGCGNSLSCGTCVAPESCGGAGLVNVCVLPDGGRGGLPWAGGYSDGGSADTVDAGSPNAGGTTSSPNSNSGCSSSGAAASVFVFALTLGLLWARRLFAGH
jgi:hypothetical protein